MTQRLLAVTQPEAAAEAYPDCVSVCVHVCEPWAYEEVLLQSSLILPGFGLLNEFELAWASRRTCGRARVSR